jgi:alkylhydroperoxidase family enzyme
MAHFLSLQAGLTDAEIAANRDGASNDPKADAAARFAVAVTKARGHVGEAELQALKAAGYSDAEATEIVMHVALNTWTNHVNEVAQIEIDFRVVKARAAA